MNDYMELRICETVADWIVRTNMPANGANALDEKMCFVVSFQRTHVTHVFSVICHADLCSLN